jgi:type VI protein secretion system component Hcp
MVRVFVDGLGCNTVAQATFGAVSFAIGLANTAGSGGGGAGKITVSDVVVEKSPDSCSLPLLLLAASGRPVKVVLTELDKTTKPILTITLAGALISTELKGSDSAEVTEQVSFSFATVTIADSAGLTTGTINR